MSLDDQAASRRKFLQFLAASPLLAGSDLAALAARRSVAVAGPDAVGATAASTS